jgi:hypothetical protein
MLGRSCRAFDHAGFGACVEPVGRCSLFSDQSGSVWRTTGLGRNAPPLNSVASRAIRDTTVCVMPCRADKIACCGIRRHETRSGTNCVECKTCRPRRMSMIPIDNDRINQVIYSGRWRECLANGCLRKGSPTGTLKTLKARSASTQTRPKSGHICCAPESDEREGRKTLLVVELAVSDRRFCTLWTKDRQNQNAQSQ